MSYKILEKNGVDNENVDGGAFNNFAAGGRDGIVGGVLSECALAAAGSTVSISPGLIMLHGIRVKVTGIETLSLSSVPIKPMSYQVVAQVTLASNGDVDFSIFIRTPQPLVQDPLYQNNVGVYQAELASFTHNSDGTISNLTKTLDIIYGSGGGSVNIEVGTVTTETLDAGLDADFDVNIRNEEGTNKILLDFDAKIPRGASGTDDQAVHFTPQELSDSQKSQARKNIGADKSLYNLGAYDTYVDNGDGTVTVTRKTRYISTKELCGITWHLNNNNAYPVFYTDGSSSYSISNSVSNSDTISFTQNVWGRENSFCTRCYQDGSVRVDISLSANEASWSVENLLSWIVQNNLYIQAEVGTSEQYTETLIAKTPINTLDANMSDIVRDEVEKTLNLADIQKQITINSGTEQWVSYTIALKAGTYTISSSNIPDGIICQIIINGDFVWITNNYHIFTIKNDLSVTVRFGNNQVSQNTTFTPTIMLNEGSHAYPYQPYNGAIVHEKQLNDALEGYITFVGVVTDINNVSIGEYQKQFYGFVNSNTSNAPSTSAGTLFTNNHSETYASQQYITDTGSFYFRDKQNGTWNAWKQVADRSWVQDNYLPLTGGTINGTINATGQVQEAGQRVYSPNNPPPGMSPRYMHHVLIRVTGPTNSSFQVIITADFSVSFTTAETNYYILLDLETGSNSVFESMLDVYNALLGIRQIGFISVNQTFSAGQGPCEIAFSSPTSGRVSALFSEGIIESSLVFRTINAPNIHFEFVSDDVEAINN